MKMKTSKHKYNPKKCSECGGSRIELRSLDSNMVPYRFWHCVKCGDEVLDMEQMSESGEAYRKLKKAKVVTVSKWGSALAIRIPKEIVNSQKIKAGYRIRIFRDKDGFRMIAERG